MCAENREGDDRVMLRKVERQKTRVLLSTVMIEIDGWQ
jgi:hypothetical protein